MIKEKLIEVLKIQSTSYDQTRMFEYITRQLDAIECEYYFNDGNIYATKGKAKLYPCIASHMDTVHRLVEDLTPIEINGNITGFNSHTMQQTGIGGDDKVGIFIALQCLERFDNIKAAFFRDEEVGCEGSYNCDVDFFKDCSFVLQCDRKGNNDFIKNASGVQLSSKKFQTDVATILKKYGYKFNTGMMTDVMALKEMDVLCSMANISCGYYNPHYNDEYVNIKDVSNCLALVMEIIEEMAGESYPCKYAYKMPSYKKFKTSFNTGKVDYKALEKKYLQYDDTDFYSKVLGESTKVIEHHCDCCDERAVLKVVSEYNMEMCQTCINRYVNVRQW